MNLYGTKTEKSVNMCRLFCICGPGLNCVIFDLNLFVYGPTHFVYHVELAIKKINRE